MPSSASRQAPSRPPLERRSRCLSGGRTPPLWARRQELRPPGPAPPRLGRRCHRGRRHSPRRPRRRRRRRRRRPGPPVARRRAWVVLRARRELRAPMRGRTGLSLLLEMTGSLTAASGRLAALPRAATSPGQFLMGVRVPPGGRSPRRGEVQRATREASPGPLTWCPAGDRRRQRCRPIARLLPRHPRRAHPPPPRPQRQQWAWSMGPLSTLPPVAWVPPAPCACRGRAWPPLARPRRASHRLAAAGGPGTRAPRSRLATTPTTSPARSSSW